MLTRAFTLCAPRVIGTCYRCDLGDNYNYAGGTSQIRSIESGGDLPFPVPVSLKGGLIQLLQSTEDEYDVIAVTQLSEGQKTDVRTVGATLEVTVVESITGEIERGPFRLKANGGEIAQSKDGGYWFQNTPTGLVKYSATDGTVVWGGELDDSWGNPVDPSLTGGKEGVPNATKIAVVGIQAPIVTGSVVVTMTPTGKLIAYDADSGCFKWKFGSFFNEKRMLPLDEGAKFEGGKFTAIELPDGETILFQDAVGRLHAVKTADGSEVWAVGDDPTSRWSAPVFAAEKPKPSTMYIADGVNDLVYQMEGSEVQWKGRIGGMPWSKWASTVLTLSPNDAELVVQTHEMLVDLNVLIGPNP